MTDLIRVVAASVHNSIYNILKLEKLPKLKFCTGFIFAQHRNKLEYYIHYLFIQFSADLHVFLWRYINVLNCISFEAVYAEIEFALVS